MPADLIVTNSVIWTGDSARPAASALAVVGEKIAALGDNGDVDGLKGPDTQVFDAEGGFM